MSGVKKETPVAPAKDAKKVAPTKDAKKVAPTKDAKKVAPAKDAKKVAPTKVVKKVAPAKDANKVAPKKDVKKVALKKMAPKKEAPRKVLNRTSLNRKAKKLRRAKAKKALIAMKKKIEVVKAVRAPAARLAKCKVTMDVLRNHTMGPALGAKAIVKVNQNKRPTKTAKPVKEIKPARVAARAERKTARMAKKADYAAKHPKTDAAPKKEVVPTPKKVVSGVKKDLLRRAKQIISNKKAYNHTRRARMVKRLVRPTGLTSYVKNVSKQTARSMSNAKSTVKKPLSSSGRKEYQAVMNMVRISRIKIANRQAALRSEGSEKEKKFEKIEKRTLPRNFLGKYGPAVPTKRKVFLSKLAKTTTVRDIMQALKPHKNDITNPRILMSTGGGKKATKDAKGKIVPRHRGCAFLTIKNESAMKMLVNNNKRRLIIKGHNVEVREATPKKTPTKVLIAAERKVSQLARRKFLKAKADKKIMQKNFLANKAQAVKKAKSRRTRVASRKLIRSKDGEVMRVILNKAVRSPRIERKRLSGMKAKKAMARRSRK